MPHPATPTFATPTPADLGRYGYAVPHSGAAVNPAGNTRQQPDADLQYQARQQHLQEVYQELQAQKASVNKPINTP